MRLLLLLLLGACGAPRSGPGLHDQLEREVIALHQKVRSLEEALETCDQQESSPDPIHRELHQILSGTRVDVRREGRVTVLVFPADLVFRDDLALREEARMPLDLLATALAKHEGHRVLVEGHTDDRAPTGALGQRYPDNWALSHARARAVARSLIEDFGVDEARFTLVARAHHDPVATNDTEAGQRRNRRIVVRLETPTGHDSSP